MHILILLLFLAIGRPAQAERSWTVGPENAIYAGGTKDLAAAVSEASSNSRTIVISTALPALTGNLTVPATAELFFTGAGLISCGSSTLTIQSSTANWPSRQIFESDCTAGRVILTGKTVSPLWWNTSACDGVTDGKAAFVAAYSSSAQIVQAPSGTCIAYGLLLPSNITLQGAGIEATTLKLKSGATGADDVITLFQVSHVVVRDLTIDANRAANGSTTAISTIFAQEADDNLFENLRLRGATQHALAILDDCDRNVAKNIIIEDFGDGLGIGTGIIIYRGADDNTVDGCYVTNTITNGTIGIRIDDRSGGNSHIASNNNKILNCTVNGNGVMIRGITIEGSSNNIIANNHVYKVTDYPIYVESAPAGDLFGSDFNLIESNHIDGPTVTASGSGIVLLGGDGNVFRGNVILNSVGNGITFFNGLTAGVTTNANLIEGNIIKSPASSGIEVRVGTANIVKGNIIHSPGVDGIRIISLSGPINGVQVDGNTTYLVGSIGIEVRSDTGGSIEEVSISNNILRKSNVNIGGFQGIRLHQSSNTLTGVSIVNNRQRDEGVVRTAAPIGIVGTPTRLLWYGNTASNLVSNVFPADTSDQLQMSGHFLPQPTDTPATCASALKGTPYFDLSLNELCFCNGTNWCKVSAPATCTSSTSCG